MMEAVKQREYTPHRVEVPINNPNHEGPTKSVTVEVPDWRTFEARRFYTKLAQLPTQFRSPDDSFGGYLAAIGKHPILTREQEIMLFHLREQTTGALNTNQENNKAKQALMEITEAITLCNTRLVIPIARRMSTDAYPIQDAVSDGNFGLMHAVTKFDYRKGNKFSTYATFWIIQSIQEGLQYEASMRIPRDIRSRLMNVAMTRINWYEEHGKDPTVEQLAEYMHLDVEKLTEMLQYVDRMRTASLDAPLTTESEASLKDVVVSNGRGEAEYYATASKVDIDRLFVQSGLTEFEKDLVWARIGFGIPWSEMPAHLGIDVSPKYLQRIGNKALATLRKTARHKNAPESNGTIGATGEVA